MLNTHQIRESEHIQFIEKQKTDTKNINYAVLDNNLIIGCIALQNQLGKTGPLTSGFTETQDSHKGLGSKMMRALLMIAFVVAALSELKLEVKPGNERAIAFYTTNGFILEHEKTSPLSIMGLLKDDEQSRQMGIIWLCSRSIQPVGSRSSATFSHLAIRIYTSF